jgi:hypothetical protein
MEREPTPVTMGTKAAGKTRRPDEKLEKVRENWTMTTKEPITKITITSSGAGWAAERPSRVTFSGPKGGATGLLARILYEKLEAAGPTSHLDEEWESLPEDERAFYRNRVRELLRERDLILDALDDEA